MASQTLVLTALLISMNVPFFSMVGATPCPDQSKFSNCAGVLQGRSPYQPYGSLFDGLTDVEATTCLCTALKAGVLGPILDLQAALTLILNTCGRTVAPFGFICS